MCARCSSTGWPHDRSAKAPAAHRIEQQDTFRLEADAEPVAAPTGRQETRLGHHLVVTDDDITWTFTFFRALADHGFTADLSPAQIGETWLNYIIEQRTILWWGGMGVSTEHTAYLRLKDGIPAPQSGSSALNSLP